MGAPLSSLSSTAGPAKWAAVIALSAACGAGLTWSLTSRKPQSAAAAPPAPITTPARTPQPQPAPTQPKPAPIAAAQPASLPAAPVQPSTLQPTAPAPQTAVPPTPPPAAQPPTTAPEPPPTPTPKAPNLTHKINVNTATGPELEVLPHIGPALAQRILDYRTLNGPFKTITDLDKVKGIGPKILEKIAPMVTVE